MPADDPAPPAWWTVGLAAVASVDGEPWWPAAIADWIASFEPTDRIEHVEVTVDLALRTVELVLWADAGHVVEGLDLWFESIGDTEQIPRFLRAHEAVDGLAGTWLRLGPAGMRTGWTVAATDDPNDDPTRASGGVGVSAVAPLLPTTPETIGFVEWAERVGASVSRVGESAGTTGDVRVMVEFPGDDVDARVVALFDLCEALAVAGPADDRIGLVAALATSGLVGEVAFFDEGIDSVSVGLGDPSTRAVLAVSSATGGAPDAALADLEGLLLAPPRTLLEVVADADDEVAARVTYRLA